MAGCAGLTLGAAVLTRANLAPFALLAPLWLAVPGQCRMTPRRQRWWAALVCAGVFALTVSPWLVRSFLLTGSVTLSTQTGFFLWLGNNPYTFSYYPHESIDRSQRADARSARSSRESGVGGARRERSGRGSLVQTEGIGIHPRASLADARQWLSEAWGCVRFIAQSSQELLAQLGARAIVWTYDDTRFVGIVGRPSELA